MSYDKVKTVMKVLYIIDKVKGTAYYFLSMCVMNLGELSIKEIAT